MIDDVALRAGLVDELTANGWLTTGLWRDAFATVPRHAFLRRFFGLTSDGAAYLAIDEHHPNWLELVYRNAAWPTQLNADPTAWQRAVQHGPITGKTTCSGTQPSLMAIMLEALDLRDGHRVLEIGTGTGYNAALLAHRVTGQQVTSVDVDPDLIAQARINLQDAGYNPIVAVADGEGGHAAAAPYDRLIATCSVATIPPAWIDQVRPGGIIITNLYRELVGQSLLRLTVADDGTASGTLLDDAGGFMPLRAHQHPNLTAIIRDAMSQNGDTRPSKLPGPITDNGPAWTYLADLLMPDVARTDIIRNSGNVQWLVHSDGSWAYHDTASGNVEQAGPQRLWDELEHIHDLWASNGKPNRNQIGVTVTPAGEQCIWLGVPVNPIRI
ncbi:MAG: ATP-grasp peptide maturase system methyltransferase [Pseudonocardiaceae bacterium]